MKRIGTTRGLAPAQVLRELKRGRRLEVHRHPRELGFTRELGRTENHGQLEDWTRPLPDGSRLHVHVMPDGKMVMHRDRWNPRRGPLHAVAHVALETRAGQVATLAGLARFLGWF